MADSTTNKFSLEDAITVYWRLRERGQNGVMARLSVEARSVDWSADQRRALRSILNKYDEQPDTPYWCSTATNTKEQV
ncbi:MAG: hypothetical protein IT324_23675 [Anaerolineae bacterium]|nr:hypothetical protein [Anaerolineae bacterium]